MPRNKKGCDNRGSALILTVLLITILLIFGASILGITEMASRSAAAQVNREQAYFTAKSAVDAMVSHLKDPATSGEQVSALIGETSTDVNLPAGMGSCTVTLSATQTDPVYDIDKNYSFVETIVLSAVGAFGGAEETYTAALTRTVAFTAAGGYENLPVAVALLDQDLSLSSSAISGNVFCEKNATLNNCAVTGDVYAQGNITMSSGTITGNLYANGNVTLSGGPAVTGNIHSGGTVTLSGGGTVDGDIYAFDDVAINGNYSGINNIYTDGNFTATNTFHAASIQTDGYINISGWGCTVSGSAHANRYVQITGGVTFGGSVYSGETVSVSSWGSRINGDVYASGDVFTNSTIVGNVHTMGAVSGSGSIGGIVPEHYTASYEYEDPLYQYNAAANPSPVWLLETVPASETTIKSNNTTVNGKDTTLTGSVSDARTIQLKSSQTEPMTVYLDTTNLSIGTLSVDNNGPVYLFLKAGADISIDAINKSGSGGLFIIGQEDTKLTFGKWQNTPEAYLYLPLGQVRTTGGIGSLVGRIVAETQDDLTKVQGVTGGTASDLEGTPFESIVRTGTGGGGASGSVSYIWTGSVVYGGA